MEKRKELTNISGRSYGIIGDKTEYKGIHIGDLILCESHEGTMYTGVVVNPYGTVSPMGSVGTRLKSLKRYEVVIPYNLLTEEVANYKHGFRFRDARIKLTKEQIEEKLGYEIEIVGE